MTRTQTIATVGNRRRWIGLAVLALPTLLLSLDISVLYLALPHLAADLGADSVAQLWILDIYSFVLAGCLVTMGTLGDRIGGRRLLLIGGACFGGASIIAALSPTTEVLIASRALLGVAGATLMPSTLALIRNMFPEPTEMGPPSACGSRRFSAAWQSDHSSVASSSSTSGGARLFSSGCPSWPCCW